MISLIRYNLKIIAPTMIWTGILVAIVTVWNLFYQFHHAHDFTAENAASIAEDLVPVMAAFFAAGVLDWEMKRGAHELLCSKKRPLWHTVAYRLAAALLIALTIGTALVLTYHFGIRHLPLGLLLLASIPSALCMSLMSLWTRIRLGNAFGGYLVVLGVWVANWFLGLVEMAFGVPVNPLFSFNSFTARMHALNAGALDTTPYVDWWWASKIALLVVSAAILFSITRRVENLVEGD